MFDWLYFHTPSSSRFPFFNIYQFLYTWIPCIGCISIWISVMSYFKFNWTMLVVFLITFLSITMHHKNLLTEDIDIVFVYGPHLQLFLCLRTSGWYVCIWESKLLTTYKGLVVWAAQEITIIYNNFLFIFRYPSPSYSFHYFSSKDL